MSRTAPTTCQHRNRQKPASLFRNEIIYKDQQTFFFYANYFLRYQMDMNLKAKSNSHSLWSEMLKSTSIRIHIWEYTQSVLKFTQFDLFQSCRKPLWFPFRNCCYCKKKSGLRGVRGVLWRYFVVGFWRVVHFSTAVA